MLSLSLILCLLPFISSYTGLPFSSPPPIICLMHLFLIPYFASSFSSSYLPPPSSLPPFLFSLLHLFWLFHLFLNRCDIFTISKKAIYIPFITTTNNTTTVSWYLITFLISALLNLTSYLRIFFLYIYLVLFKALNWLLYFRLEWNITFMWWSSYVLIHSIM